MIKRLKNFFVNFSFWVIVMACVSLLLVLAAVRHWGYIREIIEYCVNTSLFQALTNYNGIVVVAFASIFTVTLILIAFNIGVQLMRQWAIHNWINNNWIALPYRLRRLSQELGLKLSLVYAREPLVFTFGFLRPQVCLSSGALRLLSIDELMAVLHHESKHVRDYDPLKIWIINSIKKAFWFLPMTRDVERNLSLMRELNADGVAQKKMGTVKPLLSALFKIVEHQKETTLEEHDAAFFSQPGGLASSGLPCAAANFNQLRDTCAHAHFAVTSDRVEYWIKEKTFEFSFGSRNFILSLLSIFFILAVYLVPSVQAEEVSAGAACKANPVVEEKSTLKRHFTPAKTYGPISQ